MLNIAEAVKRGRYKKESDGTYTVFGTVSITVYDKATKEDVARRKAQAVGQCINYREVERQVSANITTLHPQVRNGDVIVTPSGKVRISRIEKDGSCLLEPLDGQRLSLRGSNSLCGEGNIYQLPAAWYTASIK